MSPEAKPNQRQGESPQILREEIIVPKRIRIGTARVSVNRLLTGLSDLGTEYLSCHFNVYNARPFKRTYFTENHFISEMTAMIGGFDADIPAGRGFGPGELIGGTSIKNTAIDSVLIINANLRFNNQSVNIHTAYELDDGQRLSLVMPVTISAKREILLESLLPDFTTAALSYDFAHNPDYRERLASVAQKSIPVEAVNTSPRSTVIGKVTPWGIDTQIQLNLQNFDSKNHLKCYEVEIFEGGQKNTPLTERVVPKSKYQEDQRHYCMTKMESYPFIPIQRLEEISRLKIVIDNKGSPQLMANLLGDLPLSIDGTNQWYVMMENPEGSLELFFKPEWDEKNAALVFNKVSSKRISPKEIHGALMRMDAVRNNLTERLAA